MMRDELIWIDGWLIEWARWMRADHAEINSMCGLKPSSVGFLTGGASSADTFDHMVEQADLTTIEIIDTCVRALDGQHYGALHNQYLGGVWRHRGDPLAVLEAAMRKVEAMARAKGVV